MPGFDFSSFSISNHANGNGISRIMNAALAAVDPYSAVQQSVFRSENSLNIQNLTLDLQNYEHIYLIGAGKAGYPMAKAIAECLGSRLDQGIVIVKDGYLPKQDFFLENISFIEAGHPVPDERGIAGTQKIIELAAQAGEKDLIIALISGGGSALFTSPAQGISLADLQILTRVLLACGASIDEINTLRKHLDSIKGGGLARFAAPAQLIALILSDVVGDPLEVIASGPTVPDPSTYQDAMGILEKYQITTQVPGSIFSRLLQGLQGQIGETPKPNDPVFRQVHNLIIGSNRLAALAAVKQAEQEGMNALLLTTFLQGEARTIGRTIGAIAREILASSQPIPCPACIVSGGESTVILRGDGLGGRNQELALGAVRELAGLPDTLLIALATDGGDGPTDAAGAVVSGKTLSRAMNLGLSPEDYLNRNDAYHFFETLDDLLKPGPTQTNVNDLTFLFVF